MPISEQVIKNARKLAQKALINAMSDVELKAGLLEATMLMAQAELTDDMAKFSGEAIILFSEELTKRKASSINPYPNLNTIAKLH